jgi:hypothetical protein
MLLVAITERLVNVEPAERLRAPVLLTEAEPVVLSVNVGVEVLIVTPEPIFPDVELRAIDVPLKLFPASPEIAPDPFALNARVPPFRVLAPIAMEPLLAVVVRLIDPAVLDMFEPRVTLLLSVSDRPAKLAPPVENVTAPELVTVAVPVVFKVKFGVVVLLVIFPEPDTRETEVVPEIDPAVWLIVEVPPAEIDTVAPDTLKAPSVIELLFDFVVSDIAPAELRLEPKVIGALSFSTLKLANVLPVEDTTIATELLQRIEAAPVVPTDTVGVLT